MESRYNHLRPVNPFKDDPLIQKMLEMQSNHMLNLQKLIDENQLSLHETKTKLKQVKLLYTDISEDVDEILKRIAEVKEKIR